MAEKNLENLLTAYVKPKSKIILAVSGGPDSMYLLFQCLALKQKDHFKIIVAHVNHGLRGKDSDRDEKFVASICKKYKLPFFTTRLHLNKKNNLEETARNQRYKFLEQTRKRTKADWILTAHHLNDNIETALFNLIRGAHYGGLKGMTEVSIDRHLIRPMLSLTRHEIMEYLKQKHIPYRIDKSNENTEFSRNWIRKKIIPLLMKINKNFEVTFSENLWSFAQTADHLEKQANTWLKKNVRDLSFELKHFLSAHPAAQKNILVQLYRNLYGSTVKLTLKHLHEILKVLHLDRANRKKEFGDTFFLHIVRKNGRRTVMIERKQKRRVHDNRSLSLKKSQK